MPCSLFTVLLGCLDKMFFEQRFVFGVRTLILNNLFKTTNVFESYSLTHE